MGNGAEPRCLPSPFLAGRKGHGCVQINGTLMGRQARARLPCRMPRVTHGAGTRTLPEWEGQSPPYRLGPPLRLESARPGPLFEGNPVGEGTTRRGTATPVHRPQRPAGSTHSSTRAPPPPQDPSPLRGTLGSSLRSPAEGEGLQAAPSRPSRVRRTRLPEAPGRHSTLGRERPPWQLASREARCLVTRAASPRDARAGPASRCGTELGHRDSPPTPTEPPGAWTRFGCVGAPPR